MRKGVMRTLALIGFAGDILGFVLLGASGSLDLQTLNVNSTITIPNLASGNHALFEAAAIVLTVAFIISLIAWIGGLVRTAQMRQWAWFVVMLVLGVVITLIYGFVGSSPSSQQTQQQTQS
jgi:drug/metabolite transporter (DMT)-like permease